jgi:hypothetical protein
MVLVMLGTGLNQRTAPRFALRPAVVVVLLLLAQAMGAGAVLFYVTGSPSYNTNAPGRSFTNSGWQYVGHWGGFTGTAISSNFFITAKHVGGNVGEPFVFRGVAYPTTASYLDTNTDLALWRVAGVLSPVAPLYTKPNERNKGMVLIGRGTQRGAEVRVNGVLKGWQWGESDGVQRWGRNIVNGIVAGGQGEGDVLRATFNKPGVASEGQLSSGDSGGPVFIKDGRFWKLAGVNYAVDGPFNTTNSGTGFEAAIFDARGLYVETTTGWTLVQGPTPVRSSLYATRISSRAAWIQSIISQP